MTTLRLILLALGVVLIAGVWWWSRRQQRTRSTIPRRRVERLPLQSGIDRTYPYTDDSDEEIDYAGTLADLSGLVRENRDERQAPLQAESGEATRRRAARRRHPQQIDLGFAEAAPADAASIPVLPERVVALYVRSLPGTLFTGQRLADAFAAVGMRHGEMLIFHHFGVGKLVSPEPLFSAANMFEPGTFDPATLADFTTGGIALFMQLPTRREASLVFELMLNTTQRLAERLHGEVLDDTRAPLASQSIEQLRALVKQYDQA
jgi:cell division protein ZipA